MSDQLIIQDSSYSVPARISYSFSGEQEIVSTEIQVQPRPSVHIGFHMDIEKHHHANLSMDMSGGVSPQSRVEENLHREIANKLFETHATLQKRILHEPVTLIAEKIICLSMPSHSGVDFIRSSATAKQSYLKMAEKNIYEAILLHKILDKAVSLGVRFPSQEDINRGMNEILQSVKRASRAHAKLSGTTDMQSFVTKQLHKESQLSVDEAAEAGKADQRATG